MPALFVVLCSLLGACASSRAVLPAPASANTPNRNGFAAVVDRFTEDYLSLHPNFAVGAGRHEFDGQLPDWSREGFAREAAFLQHTREELLAFQEAALSAQQHFQRAYVLSQLDADLFWLRDLRLPFNNPSYYFEHGLDPHTYVTVPYAPVEQRLTAFIRYARAIPKAVQHVRENLSQPLPKSYTDYAVAGFKGLADFYRDDVPRAFAAVSGNAEQAELRSVLEPAGRALRELAAWFAARTEYDEHVYVLGSERFRALLWQTERVDTNLPQLEALGRADLERNLTALAAACARYLPSASIGACVEVLVQDKPSGGPVEGARAQLSDLRSYLISHDLVSIPGSENAEVAESPPYMRQNFAYIDIPGPYEHGLASVYYIAPPDPAWSPQEQTAYLPGKADLLFTSVHEVWPGHFLQFLHAHRSPWRFGQLFVGYAFSEGWAHYSEALMVEQGLAEGAPDLEIGQLLNALLRNVRYLCAIGLHTQGMSVAECEELFKTKAYQDAGNARQQAARGTYDPGYLNYTLGKLMIRKLRADWQAENPGHSLREFHDRFLSYGGPPLPLLRDRLLRSAGTALF